MSCLGESCWIVAPQRSTFFGFELRQQIKRRKGDLMYYQAISQCTKMLRNLESWLDKAEEHAGAKASLMSVS